MHTPKTFSLSVVDAIFPNPTVDRQDIVKYNAENVIYEDEDQTFQPRILKSFVIRDHIYGGGTGVDQ